MWIYNWISYEIKIIEKEKRVCEKNKHSFIVIFKIDYINKHVGSSMHKNVYGEKVKSQFRKS